MVPIIAKAPADTALRCKWLEQLYQAHADDQIPYIECLGDYWGELCASRALAGEWADRLVETVAGIWRRHPAEHGFFHGTTMCLSALLAAGRHEPLLALLETCPYPFWGYRQWGVKALLALGRKTEALRYAEATRGVNDPMHEIATTCEAILLSSGLADEAYQRYALAANRGATYLATFRAICRKYPRKKPEAVLNDLVASTPGEEGKWFAAAKDAKLYQLALQLAQKSPVDHRTLIRSASDFVTSEPNFTLNSGLLALYWICAGRVYEASVDEVRNAYDLTIRAEEQVNGKDDVLQKIRQILKEFPKDRLVSGALASASELWRDVSLAARR